MISVGLMKLDENMECRYLLWCVIDLWVACDMVDHTLSYF